MIVVGARVGRDQHLAGGCDFARDVLSGAVQLELVDRALRDVEDGRADRLVGDVLPVQKDAGGAAGDAANRDGRISGLGWVERLPALQDHSGLDLGQIEEIAPIYRQVLDLLRGNNVAYTCLICVELYGTRINLNGLG